METEKQYQEALRWLKQGQHEWVVAKALMEVSPAMSCFQSQQSVEKALKAVMMRITGDTPHTNSVRELFEKAQENGLVMNRNVRNLDTYYMLSRYPDANPGDKAPFELYDVMDAQESLKLAQEAIKQVRSFFIENELLPENALPVWDAETESVEHQPAKPQKDFGHEAHLKIQGSEDQWFSMNVYADTNNALKATLQITENGNVKVHEKQVAVISGKHGELCVSGNTLSATIQPNRQVQFFEGETQVRGQFAPRLKPKGQGAKPAALDPTENLLAQKLGAKNNRGMAD